MRANRDRQPPPSFHPDLPPTTASQPTGASASAATTKPAALPDLIARYKLTGKLAEPAPGPHAGAAAHGAADEDDDDDGSAKPAPAWAASRTERAALLAKRREEMILGARRRMEARDKRRAETGKAVVR